MIAAGLHGIESGLELEPAVRGQRLRVRSRARAAHARRCPRPLRDSEVARTAFGEEVVDHYLNRARVELDAFDGGGHRLGARAGLRTAVNGMISVLEPATEQVMAEVPRAGAEEVDAAVERARAAFPAWRAVAPGDRARAAATPR